MHQFFSQHQCILLDFLTRSQGPRLLILLARRSNNYSALIEKYLPFLAGVRFFYFFPSL